MSAPADPRFRELLDRLRGGDRRSIGRAEEVAAEVERSPDLFPALVAGLTHEEPVVRMRSADAMEKVSARHPEWLAPHKRHLLDEVSLLEDPESQEVRWHLALLLPRLPLEEPEVEKALEILRRFLGDESRIVRVNSMQALADLAALHPRLRPTVLPLLRELTRSGTPAMQARGRRLLKRLERR